MLLLDARVENGDGGIVCKGGQGGDLLDIELMASAVAGEHDANDLFGFHFGGSEGKKQGCHGLNPLPFDKPWPR